MDKKVGQTTSLGIMSSGKKINMFFWHLFLHGMSNMFSTQGGNDKIACLYQIKSSHPKRCSIDDLVTTCMVASINDDHRNFAIFFVLYRVSWYFSSMNQSFQLEWADKFWDSFTRFVSTLFMERLFKFILPTKHSSTPTTRTPCLTECTHLSLHFCDQGGMVSTIKFKSSGPKKTFSPFMWSSWKGKPLLHNSLESWYFFQLFFKRNISFLTSEHTIKEVSVKVQLYHDSTNHQTRVWA